MNNKEECLYYSTYFYYIWAQCAKNCFNIAMRVYVQKDFYNVVWKLAGRFNIIYTWTSTKIFIATKVYQTEKLCKAAVIYTDLRSIGSWMYVWMNIKL